MAYSLLSRRVLRSTDTPLLETRALREDTTRLVRQGMTSSAFLLVACSSGDPTGLPNPSLDSEVGQFVLLANEHRATVGCPALSWNEPLAGVAQDHSDDMVRRGFFSHTNPDGDSLGDRLGSVGVHWSRWAENIAAGQPTGEVVLDSWLASPGHRENLENCLLTQHGVGLVDRHWTHVFTSP